MVSLVQEGTNNTDELVDTIIKGCLDPESPTSFFLYAGAGSGKTYSLVKALEEFEVSHGEKFRRSGKKVAVITYTNAACDEIVDRVKGNPLFHISTIHSFCWLQIKVFHDDIRAWLRTSIPEEISKLEQEEAKGRQGTQASITRQRSIANKQERLLWLAKRREFTYNPNGDNIGKDSLSHSEVIKICSDFLVNKPSFQQILVNRYPFLLIDESQDTNKDLIESFFAVEEHKNGEFGLGLIGDMMQRIYGDGKHDLGNTLPDRWKKPNKLMNRRCPKRIVALANDIRSETDKQEQKFLEGKPDGVVRFFIASSSIASKTDFEQAARVKMAEVTGDVLWHNTDDVKHLMLEHKMAAVRMGFKDMFEALSTSKGLQTGLRSGDLPPVRFFSEYVFPLCQLEKEKNSHGVMTHLRKAKSPLIDPHFLRSESSSGNPLIPIKKAIKEVLELVNSSKTISFLDVLQCVAKNNIFSIPQSLIPFSEASDSVEEEDTEDNAVDEEEKTSSHKAIDNFLRTAFKQIEPYKKYVSREAAFDTHQGVKGREFERVLVVMDDEEAGGFLFSYEKMFEITPLTKGDLEKRSRGEEIGVDRTRRLFYVTCTRAERSLALIAYTQNPALLKKRAIEKGWFEETEVIQF